jgi:hypothetical protein
VACFLPVSFFPFSTILFKVGFKYSQSHCEDGIKDTYKLVGEYKQEEGEREKKKWRM